MSAQRVFRVPWFWPIYPPCPSPGPNFGNPTLAVLYEKINTRIYCTVLWSVVPLLATHPLRPRLPRLLRPPPRSQETAPTQFSVSLLFLIVPYVRRMNVQNLATFGVYRVLSCTPPRAPIDSQHALT